MRTGDIVRVISPTEFMSKHRNKIATVIYVRGSVIGVQVEQLNEAYSYHISRLELVKSREPKYPKLWSK